LKEETYELNKSTCISMYRLLVFAQLRLLIIVRRRMVNTCRARGVCGYRVFQRRLLCGAAVRRVLPVSWLDACLSTGSQLLLLRTACCY
jgi:hypothetical protein